MTRKKDLQHLHVRVKPETAEKLKSWADELGDSMGEMIDQIVQQYEHFCDREDDVLKDTEIHETLQRLCEKIDNLSSRIK